ncbi:chitinase, partial [Listeria booriae]|nr:chitinase [Listeria booriae]
ITNNEKADETNEVLKSTELAFETVKLPKFYIPVKAGETLTAGDYKVGTVTTSGGNTVVDLASVYDAQQIPQGASYTFRLKSSAATVDVNNISKIDLTQRMVKSSVEFSKQTIYGGGSVVPDPTDTEAPTVPKTVVSSNVTGKSATLTWTASTDNKAVAGYKIYRNGTEVGS